MRRFEAVVDITFSKTIIVDAENEEAAWNKVNEDLEEFTRDDLDDSWNVADKSVAHIALEAQDVITPLFPHRMKKDLERILGAGTVRVSGENLYISKQSAAFLQELMEKCIKDGNFHPVDDKMREALETQKCSLFAEN